VEASDVLPASQVIEAIARSDRQASETLDRWAILRAKLTR
jgi:hypothetical protein